jgi:hypothetical protein
VAGYRVWRRVGGAGDFELIDQPLRFLTRHFDRDVTPGTLYEYSISAVDVWGNESGQSEVVSATPLEHSASTLPIYEVEIAEDDLVALTEDITAEDYVPCVFRHNGETFGAEIRFRGNISRFQNKKNWKIRFPRDDLFEDQRAVNLQSMGIDPSMLRDRVSYWVYEQIGGLTPATQPVHLAVNGEFMGVYLQVEQTDQHFLERRGLDACGNIYDMLTSIHDYDDILEFGPASYEVFFDSDNDNWDGDFTDILAFMDEMTTLSQERYGAEIPLWLNLESFLDFFSPAVGLGDRDIIVHNFIFAFDDLTERWQMINWDHSAVFQDATLGIIIGTLESQSPSTQAWNLLYDRLMQVPHIRAAHFRRLREVLEGPLHPFVVHELIEDFAAEMRFDAMRDIRKRGRENPSSLLSGINGVDAYAAQHHADLLVLLADAEIDLGPVAGLRINEVMSDNATTLADEMGDFDPWVEVVNVGESAASLDGLFFSAAVSNLTEWPFPSGLSLDPGDSVILWLDGETGEGPLHSSFALNPAVTVDLSLVASDGTTTLDQITVAGLAADQSLGSFPDGTFNKIVMGAPTPGAANLAPEATVNLRLNEVLALNASTVADEFGDFDPWVEIHNLMCTATDLGLMYLTDDLAAPTKWQIPAGVTVPPEGHLVIWLDGETGEGDSHAGFALAPMAGELALIDTDGSTTLDQISFPAPMTDVSYGRVPDGSDAFASMTIPTPGAANLLLGVTEVRINELLASNDSFGMDETGAFEDWIELVNLSDAPIDLGGHHLTDDFSNPTRWQLPFGGDAVIPANGRLLIWADDDNNPPDGPLHTNFQLSAAGESVSLFAPDGATLIDTMTFGPQDTDLSEARLPDATGAFHQSALPTPMLVNQFAVSLQRIVDAVLGREFLSPNEALEADRDDDLDIDSADVVRGVGLPLPE